MSDLDYAWEQYHAALSTLAANAGPLHGRITDAWVSRLNRLSMKPRSGSDGSISVDLEKRMDAVTAMLQGRTFGPDSEGMKAISEEIMSIFIELDRQSELAHPT
jgi:hypothetical protein